jgi:hypothetical protein
VHLEQDEAAELLLGLDERPVGDAPVAALDAVCDSARPSHAISTPASRAASSNACQAAISLALSSGEKSSGPRSSPYSVSSTLMSHLRRVAAIPAPRIMQ